MNRTCEVGHIFPGTHGYNKEALLDEFERRWGDRVLDYILTHRATPKAVDTHEWSVRCISVGSTHDSAYWRVWDRNSGDSWTVTTNHLDKSTQGS